MSRSQITPELITDLDISVRCMNTLRANNIELVSQLTALTILDLHAMRSISSKTINEIIELLVSLGLELKPVTAIPIEHVRTMLLACFMYSSANDNQGLSTVEGFTFGDQVTHVIKTVISSPNNSMIGILSKLRRK